jgi:hypothetical protein
MRGVAGNARVVRAHDVATLESKQEHKFGSPAYHLRGAPRQTHEEAARNALVSFTAVRGGEASKLTKAAQWAGIEHLSEKSAGWAETAVPTRRANHFPVSGSGRLGPRLASAVSSRAPPLWRPGARADADNRDPRILKIMRARRFRRRSRWNRRALINFYDYPSTAGGAGGIAAPLAGVADACGIAHTRHPESRDRRQLTYPKLQTLPPRRL